MLPEGTLAEVIDNQLFMSPSPTGKHQRVLTKLFLRIGLFIEQNGLGEVFAAPFDVFLDEERNAVQPDFFFVSKDNLSIVDNEGTVHGVPDLIIEILSPGNKTFDQVTKKELYERYGVKEYWTIDPGTRETKGYTLVGSKYQIITSSAGRISSHLLKAEFII